MPAQEPQDALPLASLRKRKLLSQRALARQAGVALSTIYLLEASKTEHATFKVMRAVSDALGVPPESIAEFRRVMDAAPNPNPPPPTRPDLHAAISSLVSHFPAPRPEAVSLCVTLEDGGRDKPT